VVRIETVSCTQSGIGTGFLISPRLVATVAHVVDQAVVVSLIGDDGQRTTGSVIGMDRNHDLALIRATKPIIGFHFSLNSAEAPVGDDVATIGFPIGDPLTFTRGTISGLNRNIRVNGTVYTGLIETDTPINPGNSGGPLISATGRVVGLVDAKNPNATDIAYAVPASEATARIGQWRSAPALPPATCADPLGPHQARPDVPAAGAIDQHTAASIAAAFNTYFGGIDTGNYRAAYSVLSPRLQQTSSYREFSQGDATSYDSDIEVLDAKRIDAGTVDVALSFVSLQRADKGPSGETCDTWTLQYTMRVSPDGSWLIDGVAPYGRSDHTPC
jgi:S1-C subfamily serine protease